MSYALIAWDLLKKFWPFLLVGILLLVGYIHLQHILHDAYQRGVNDTTSIWQAKFNQAEADNQKMTNLLQQELNDYSQKIDQLNKDRQQQENTHTNTIEKIVTNNPVYQKCVVDQSILDERNKIRALGPKL